MKPITVEMMKTFKLQKYGCDFMGYRFSNKNQLSAHHLIIPARHGGKLTWNNTVILRQNTSHDYLHIVENNDHDRFLAITSELIDENISGRLDINNLKRIKDILMGFEKEYRGKTTRKGKVLIKEEYISGRILY